MKPSARYLVPLLVVLFLIIVPLPVAEAALTSLYSYLHISSGFKLFEVYHLAIVAALCSGLLVYSYARGYIGSHRSLYSSYGILLFLLTFFQTPLPPVYSLLLALIVIASMDAVFIYAVRARLSRISFLSMSLPLVVVAFLLPSYYMAISGFVIFSCSFFVRPGTRGISILDVNMGAMGTQGFSPAAGVAGPAVPGGVNPPVTPGNTVKNQPQAGTKGSPRRGSKASESQRRIFSGHTKNVPSSTPGRPDPLPANVPWPGQSEYARAMQNLGFSISPDYASLRSCRVVPNPYIKLPGNLAYSSGNYGIIFKLENNGAELALKCFTRSKQDLNTRYFAISRALSPLSGRGLAFVNFQYLPGAIRTFKNPAMYFPVLRMDWVEGKNLNTFITEQLRSKDRLCGLASTFIDRMVQIRRAGIAHGDISGDNIVIGPSGTFTLVDYDGMYIPEFSGSKSPELGHDNFQHPRRTQNDYSERLDNFSILVTYLSLLSVAEDPSLWTRYNKGDQDCLIFRKADFVNTSRSGVIAELLKMRGRVAQLAGLLCEAVKHDPLWEGCDPQQVARI